MEAAFLPEVNNELDTQNFEKFDEVRNFSIWLLCSCNTIYQLAIILNAVLFMVAVGDSSRDFIKIWSMEKGKYQSSLDFASVYSKYLQRSSDTHQGGINTDLWFKCSFGIFIHKIRCNFSIPLPFHLNTYARYVTYLYVRDQNFQSITTDIHTHCVGLHLIFTKFIRFMQIVISYQKIQVIILYHRYLENQILSYKFLKGYT